MVLLGRTKRPGVAFNQTRVVERRRSGWRSRLPRIPFVSVLPPRSALTPARGAGADAAPPTPRAGPNFEEQPWPLDPAKVNWGAWLPRRVRPTRAPAVSALGEVLAPDELGLNTKQSSDQRYQRARDLRRRLTDACLALDQDHWAELFAFVLELAEWTTRQRRQLKPGPTLPGDWSAASWIASRLDFDSLESWRELGFRNLLVERAQSPRNDYRYSSGLEHRIHRAEDLGFRVVTSVDIVLPESSESSAPDGLRQIPALQAIEQMLVGVAHEVAEGALGVRAASVGRWYAPLPTAQAEAKTHALLSVIKLFLRMVSSEEILYADAGASVPATAETTASSPKPDVSMKYLGSAWEQESTSSEGDLLTGVDIGAFIETIAEAEPETFVDLLTQIDEPLFHGQLLHQVTETALRRLVGRARAETIILKAMFLLPGTLRFEERALDVLALRPQLRSLLGRLNQSCNQAPSLWSAEVRELSIPTEGRQRAFVKRTESLQLFALLNLEKQRYVGRWTSGIQEPRPPQTLVSRFDEDGWLQVGAEVEVRAPAEEFSVWVSAADVVER